ncbi:MAG: beta-lactamase family protein [Acidobacteriota bacterium]|nr:beta-lactamase family protein [Acidobacteriota bacterium]
MTTVKTICAAVMAVAMLHGAASARAQQASALRPGEVRDGDAAARVDEYLSRLVRHGFSGAVLIAAVPPRGDWATQGRIVLKRAYGMADRAAGLPYTVDMVSTIGSITKQFTGAAIVKLEMMGKLKTSDPIAKYLPGVPADKAGITIHHLLTHTAGFAGELGGADNDAIDRDALVARVLAAPLAHAPGAQFEYSNEGYSLAGAIIERVSGQGYEAFLREHLFLTSGMNDTGYQARAWAPAQLPIGYTASGDAWGRIHKRGWLPDGPGWYLRANGGIHSTLDDMYRWHLALESTAVLSADARDKYQTGYAPTLGGTEHYAYGWGVRTSRRGGRVISHNGGNMVFGADVRRYVDEGVVIIVMTNQPVIPAPQLAPRQIESLYFGDQDVVMPPAPLDVPRPRRNALSGMYAAEGGGTVTIRATDDGLEAQASDPALFGALGSLTPPGGRFAAAEAKTLPLLDAAANGNFRPLYDARNFDDGRPFAGVEAQDRAQWDAWRAAHGAFVRVELLGTSIVRGDPAVTVRLVFERGGPTMQYVWGPKRLFLLREVPASPVALVAESPDTWVYYSYQQPRLVRLRFGAGGRLDIDGLGGRITARK